MVTNDPITQWFTQWFTQPIGIYLFMMVGSPKVTKSHQINPKQLGPWSYHQVGSTPFWSRCSTNYSLVFSNFCRTIIDVYDTDACNRYINIYIYIHMHIWTYIYIYIYIYRSSRNWTSEEYMNHTWCRNLDLVHCVDYEQSAPLCKISWTWNGPHCIPAAWHRRSPQVGDSSRSNEIGLWSDHKVDISWVHYGFTMGI